MSRRAKNHVPPREPAKVASSPLLTSPRDATYLEAPFAITSTGVFLINAATVTGFDVTGRALFIGASLTEAEQLRAQEQLANAADEQHARLGGGTTDLPATTTTTTTRTAGSAK